MKIDQIIFATGNEGKMKEIRMILSDADLSVQSMKEAGISVQIIEDGKTFEENALIKARAVAAVSGLPAMADDSGLEVDFMDRAPGILSARFLGEDTSYRIKNQYIIDRLKDAKGAERSARFVCAIALVVPNPEKEGQFLEYTTQATIEGEIGYEEKGSEGFGYDPIFVVPEFGRTTAELTPEEKNQISHRGKALRSMKEVIVKLREDRV